ncbi:hypothetical protein [Erwinia mallotivora]|uniref:hypothetical protein n=1 Tax=Erwinia mallotivora TaxID=69222 RepID=UPI0021BEB47B|nr:hypothetical protein [Erwinia mallotivora]
MNRLKILISIIGCTLVMVLAFLGLFPTLAHLITGPIVSNDQMDQNALILLIGTPLSGITGAVTGGLYMRYYLNKKRQR